MRLIFDSLYYLRIFASLYQRNYFNKNEITNINIGCFSLINFLNLFRFFFYFFCGSLLDGEVKKILSAHLFGNKINLNSANIDFKKFNGNHMKNN